MGNGPLCRRPAPCPAALQKKAKFNYPEAGYLEDMALIAKLKSLPLPLSGPDGLEAFLREMIPPPPNPSVPRSRARFCKEEREWLSESCCFAKSDGQGPWIFRQEVTGGALEGEDEFAIPPDFMELCWDNWEPGQGEAPPCSSQSCPATSSMATSSWSEGPA